MTGDGDSIMNVDIGIIINSANEDMSSSLFDCLFVCMLAILRKIFRRDLHEIVREGWQWANEQVIKFWWQSGSHMRIRIRIQIRIAMLVRRALAEYALSQCF